MCIIKSFLDRAIYWSIWKWPGQAEARQTETTANLESVIKIANFTKIIQELVDPRLVIFHKRIKRDHVRFFGIGRFVRQILQHFRNLLMPSQ